MMGQPELRQAVADHHARFQWLTLSADDVPVTLVATEALAAALPALVSPGDEVLLIQPMYDAYRPLVLRAGGIPRYLTRRPPHWRLEAEDIERAFASGPRIVVFNDPLNLAARAFGHDEVALLAGRLPPRRHDRDLR